MHRKKSGEESIAKKDTHLFGEEGGVQLNEVEVGLGRGIYDSIELLLKLDAA